LTLGEKQRLADLKRVVLVTLSSRLGEKSLNAPLNVEEKQMDAGLDTANNRRIYDEMQKDETVRCMTYDAFLRSQHARDLSQRKMEFDSRRIKLKHVGLSVQDGELTATVQ
jgi:hypothetical protein